MSYLEGGTLRSERKTHWETVYTQKSEQELSWHQDDPKASIELIQLTKLHRDAAFIDIGGGTSNLTVAMLRDGFKDLSVLDISQAALETVGTTLGDFTDLVNLIEADITAWQPSRIYDFWHDRAVFHFLVDPVDRQHYLECLEQATHVGSFILMATFSLEGPETCSGHPVKRYDSKSISEVLGPAFQIMASRDHLHVTPWGKPQPFQYSLFERVI